MSCGGWVWVGAGWAGLECVCHFIGGPRGARAAWAWVGCTWPHAHTPRGPSRAPCPVVAAACLAMDREGEDKVTTTWGSVVSRCHTQYAWPLAFSPPRLSPRPQKDRRERALDVRGGAREGKWEKGDDPKGRPRPPWPRRRPASHEERRREGEGVTLDIPFSLSPWARAHTQRNAKMGSRGGAKSNG